MTESLQVSPLEAVGPKFTTEQMLFVRDRTRDALRTIAAQITPGMVEEDAVEMAKDVLSSLDMLQGWHGVFVRFGSNTLKTFGADSEPGIVLGSDDIFFLDIGPVWQQWEGDSGETFVVGADEEMKRAKADVETLFHAVRRKWLSDGSTGQELYVFAVSEAERMGWELNMDLSGHRLSDFPHAAIYDGPLADIDFKPAPLIWVLEIHLRHPKRNFGAFYEDMLLGDDYFH